MGVNATWDLLDSLTPAVPFFKRIVNHIERSFGLEHSTKHTIPSAEIDIMGLIRMYQEGDIYKYRAKRDNSAKPNSPKDVVTLAEASLQDSNYLDELFKDRWSYIANMNTLEDYSLPTSSVSTSSVVLPSLRDTGSEESSTPDETHPLRLFVSSIED
jgi:hypothetical protein